MMEFVVGNFPKDNLMAETETVPMLPLLLAKPPCAEIVQVENTGYMYHLACQR